MASKTQWLILWQVIKYGYGYNGYGKSERVSISGYGYNGKS